MVRFQTVMDHPWKRRFAAGGLLLLLLLPTVVSAASFENLGPTLGLGAKDLKQSFITFVQWLLGVLALIAVVMILIGGFTWMTAAGNEERVAKAKRTISAAIIGLVVIMISWAIAIFTVGVVSNATQ